MSEPMTGDEAFNIYCEQSNGPSTEAAVLRVATEQHRRTMREVIALLDRMAESVESTAERAALDDAALAFRLQLEHPL